MAIPKIFLPPINRKTKDGNIDLFTAIFKKDFKLFNTHFVRAILRLTSSHFPNRTFSVPAEREPLLVEITFFLLLTYRSVKMLNSLIVKSTYSCFG